MGVYIVMEAVLFDVIDDDSDADFGVGFCEDGEEDGCST